MSGPGSASSLLGLFDPQLTPVAWFDSALVSSEWFDVTYGPTNYPRLVSRKLAVGFEKAMSIPAWFDDCYVPSMWFDQSVGSENTPTLTTLPLSLWFVAPAAPSDPWQNYYSALTSGDKTLVSSGSIPGPTVGDPVNGYVSAYFDSTAQSFTPASLGATLKAWYLETYDALNGIWTDEVGGLNTTPSTAGSTPAAGSINGHPAVEFDGTGVLRITDTAILGGANQMTLFCVLDANTFSGYQAAIGRSYLTYGFWLGADYGQAPTGSASFWASDNTAVVAAGQVAYSNSPLTTATVHTLVAVYNGGTMRLYLDGVAQTDSALQSYTNVYEGGATDAITIGGTAPGSDSGIAYLFDGTIGNVGICDTALTGTDLTNLIDYLATWAGI